MTKKESLTGHVKWVADWQTFSLSQQLTGNLNGEAKTVLMSYLEQIFFDLYNFLQKQVGISKPVPLEQLAKRFSSSHLRDYPEKTIVEVMKEIIEEIAPHAVNVASPYFIGHMTAAIPFFMIHFQAVVAALNQNVVKLETSGVVSLRERQVLAQIHRAIYAKPETFYQEHIQNFNSTLGGFVEDGTLANLTALWVARNVLLKPKKGFAGVEQEGMAAAYKAYNIERCVVLVSQLGHYSLWKVAGVLGIGHQNVLPIEVDQNHRINIDQLRLTINTLQQEQPTTKILAVVGIAGATETGTIDPLATLAEICAENQIHFHVDAAWGGPTLLSAKYRHLLAGIEQADSVTIDGHKQFYMPMSCGMVYFKDPNLMKVITYHAHYITRPGSADLGIRSLAGSREATSLILGSALEIMGAKGYAQLIEYGIEMAQQFAQEIEKRYLFELITPPQLNILTYGICPSYIRKAWKKANTKQKQSLIEHLDYINCVVQQRQKEAGNSFVSRTTLKRPAHLGGNRKVLRAVIMNPMTNIDIIREILDEQEQIYKKYFKLNHGTDKPGPAG